MACLEFEEIPNKSGLFPLSHEHFQIGGREKALFSCVPAHGKNLKGTDNRSALMPFLFLHPFWVVIIPQLPSSASKEIDSTL